MNQRNYSAGFTMLEVLVSIVVIAFGLLGIAGLQAFAVKNNQSAGLRLIATTVAIDMVDRVHANESSMTVNGTATGYNKPAASDYNAPVAGCRQVAGCTTFDMAQNDLAEWKTLVTSALPQGEGIVCLDNTPNDGTSAADPQCDGVGLDNYVVKIWWRDDRSGNPLAVNLQRLSWPFRP